jgi:hypothetical protein
MDRETGQRAGKRDQDGETRKAAEHAARARSTFKKVVQAGLKAAPPVRAAMSATDPTTWSAVVWALTGLAVYYTVDFFLHFFRFRRLGAAVAAGEPGAVRAYNRALRGFPRSGYAKMLGRTRLVESEEKGGRAPR